MVENPKMNLHETADKIYLKKNGFSKKDIKQTAVIHIEEINKGFLSSLGNKALELIYFHISENNSSILILAIDQERDCVCGFICGTLNLRALYKEFLKKKMLQAFMHIAPRLISFDNLRKALETLCYPAKKEFSNMPQPELFNFAISKDYQGGGLAQKLFMELVGTFKQKGVKKFKIGTGEGLIRAQKFYKKMGAAELDFIEIHKGQRSLVYIYQIT